MQLTHRMELEETTQQQRLMNWCKNRFCSDAKTNTAAAASSAIYIPVQGIYCTCSVQQGERPETASQKTETKSGPPERLWPLLAEMPALSHWPDRSKPFDYADSEVIAFITARCGVSQTNAIRIFDSARPKGVLKFDHETKLWCGTKGGRS